MRANYHLSFQKSIKLLQTTITASDYEKLMYQERYREVEHNSSYFDKLPTYLVARCPLCGSHYESKIDTHGIFEWTVSTELYHMVFHHQYQSVGCAHFVGVNTFFNLNGNFPTEKNYFSSANSDIPIFTPELLLDDMPGSAVMHSLPVCRIENGNYVPRYSVYMITYFAEDSEKAYFRALSLLYPEKGKDDDGYSPGTVFPLWSRTYPSSELKKLERWVKAGKLYWLDLDDPALPLRMGDVEKFPYQGIKGFGTPYTYWKRERPDHWWQRLRWHPDGEIWAKYYWNKLLAKPDW